MIKLNVAEIKKSLVDKKAFLYDLKPEELGLSSEEIKIKGPIHVEGDISNVGDVLLLKAKLSAEVDRTCGRCLKDLQGTTEAEVLEKFYLKGTENVENDAYVYESDIVDITEPLRESLLLAEPLSVLCREDCLGLCPVCGCDRNIKDCGCDTFTIDPRLSALKQFIKD